MEKKSSNIQEKENGTITVRKLQTYDFKTEIRVSEEVEATKVLMSEIQKVIGCNTGTWFVTSHNLMNCTRSMYLVNGYATMAVIIMSELNEFGTDFHQIKVADGYRPDDDVCEFIINGGEFIVDVSHVSSLWSYDVDCICGMKNAQSDLKNNLSIYKTYMDVEVDEMCRLNKNMCEQFKHKINAWYEKR